MLRISDINKMSYNDLAALDISLDDFRGAVQDLEDTYTVMDDSWEQLMSEWRSFYSQSVTQNFDIHCVDQEWVDIWGADFLNFMVFGV